jgi:hypothetical protein
MRSQYVTPRTVCHGTMLWHKKGNVLDPMSNSFGRCPLSDGLWKASKFFSSPKVYVNSRTAFLLAWLTLQSLLFASKELGFRFKINQCFQLYI